MSLKIHPFRLVTIVQWWQQSLSSGSELWLCLGILLGACDYCDYSDCSVVTLTPHRRLFYIKFREIMSSRMSASRALRSLQSQRMAELIEKSDVRHNIKNVTSHNTPAPLLSSLLSQYHNPGKIYHGNTMETSSQYQHQYTSPTPLSTIFTVDSCSIL